MVRQQLNSKQLVILLALAILAVFIIKPQEGFVQSTISMEHSMCENSDGTWVIDYHNSTTPLIITDLVDISLSGLTFRSYGGNSSIEIKIGSAEEVKGGLELDLAEYADLDESSTSPIYIEFTEINMPIVLYDNDYVTIHYDNNLSTNILLPDYIGTNIKLYISTEGSTYYDIGLTQLAHALKDEGCACPDGASWLAGWGCSRSGVIPDTRSSSGGVVDWSQPPSGLIYDPQPPVQSKLMVYLEAYKWWVLSIILIIMGYIIFEWGPQRGFIRRKLK